jgi:uncharacterized protein involved in exopolysaccharide biosynthesis
MAPDSEHRTDDEEADDPNAISPWEIAGFVWRAARRHPALGVIVGLCVAVLGATIVAYIPPQYEAFSKILIAQAASVETALSNPDRQVPNVDVLGGAPELLMQKPNLTWIVQESDLLARWKSSRPVPMRIKDYAQSVVLGQPTEAELADALVKMLEKRMTVTRENAVLKINVVWNDGESAAKIATLAQNRFLEQRRTQEMSVITSAIAILEDESKRAADLIDPALQEVIRAQLASRAANTGASAAPAAAPPAPAAQGAAPARVAPAPRAAPGPDAKVAERLSALRVQIAQAEAPYQRRLADLRLQLVELRTNLGPAHPQVLAHEAKIREASTLPAEVAALRNQERELLAQLESSPYDDGPAPAPVVRTPAAAPAPAAPAAPAATARSDDRGQDRDREREEDPTVTASRAKLKAAIDHYSTLNKRLDSARLELITAQSAFQHKYIVVAEPENPRKPFKPKRALLLAGVMAAALAIGLLAGAVRELLTGRVIEPWQLKPIGLPVLGELRLPPKSEP